MLTSTERAMMVGAVIVVVTGVLYRYIGAWSVPIALLSWAHFGGLLERIHQEDVEQRLEAARIIAAEERERELMFNRDRPLLRSSHPSSPDYTGG